MREFLFGLKEGAYELADKFYKNSSYPYQVRQIWKETRKDEDLTNRMKNIMFSVVLPIWLVVDTAYTYVLMFLLSMLIVGLNDAQLEIDGVVQGFWYTSFMLATAFTILVVWFNCALSVVYEIFRGIRKLFKI